MKPIVAVLLLSGALAFACPPPKPKPVPPTPTATNVNTNTNTNTATSASNSSSIAASSASSNQTQGQQQSQSATGGNSAASNSNSNKVAASAIAPLVLPTVPCFKGAGGAVQVGMVGGAFGGGKVDQGCDDRELARSFSGPQTVASCKILINTKKAKKAHITMEDCLDVQPVPAQVNSAVPVQVNPAPVSREVQTIVVPVTVQPVVTVLAPPEYKTSIDVYPPKPVVKKKSAVKQPPAGCHYEPAKVVTRKLVCE